MGNTVFDAKSFSSANVYPAKLLIDKELMLRCLDQKEVIPRHLQLNPTNHCNFNCDVCSCSGRNRELELSSSQISTFTNTFKKLGGKSATITGGGEALSHPNISEIIDDLILKNIKVGIATNGSLLKITWKQSYHFNKITWIRVSSTDFLHEQINVENWFKQICCIVNKNPNVDWAFSHVLSSLPNFLHVAKLVNFANNHNFTHVRIVNDIFNAEHQTHSINQVKQYLERSRINDSKVNYQPRNTWTLGTKKCYLSLVKPVLGADGYIYPCCGCQYSLSSSSRNYEETMRMCHMDDFESLVKKQQFFDGSNCVKCYYDNYNQILDTWLNGKETIIHKEFS